MDKPINRLDFIQELGRKGMLLGLTGLGVAALHGSKSVEECINTGVCGSCQAYGGCTLPEKQELPQ